MSRGRETASKQVKVRNTGGLLIRPFATNGRISGPPVFRGFTPLEAISGPRDLSQTKDLAETHLFVLVSSNFDRFLIPIDNGL